MKNLNLLEFAKNTVMKNMKSENENETETEVKSVTAKDPFEMLIEDHKHVKKNFEAFEKSNDKSEKYDLFVDTVLSLVVHTKLEEELVYPLMKQADEDLEKEAEEEHRVVDFVITEMKGMSADDEKFDAKFTVLAELVKHHIKEEEEEAFPEMKELDYDFAELAERMTARKLELQEEYADLESVEPLQSEAMQHRKAPARKRPTRPRVAAKSKTSASSGGARANTKKSASAKPGAKKSGAGTKKSAAKTTGKKAPAKTTAKKKPASKNASSNATSKKKPSSATGSKKIASTKKASPKASSKKPATKKAATKKTATKKVTKSKTSGSTKRK